ncbi:MAG: hypothetical protein LLF96_04160 [Eubacteriales bacterium]|nr:hypothetical protein [Eubacteriales bacterium]
MRVEEGREETPGKLYEILAIPDAEWTPGLEEDIRARFDSWCELADTDTEHIPKKEQEE